MPFTASWMDLEMIHLNHLGMIWQSESERKRQMPYDMTYIRNLKSDTDLSMKQKQIHRHGEQTCGCQRGAGRWRSWMGNLGLAGVKCCI